MSNLHKLLVAVLFTVPTLILYILVFGHQHPSDDLITLLLYFPLLALASLGLLITLACQVEKLWRWLRARWVH